MFFSGGGILSFLSGSELYNDNEPLLAYWFPVAFTSELKIGDSPQRRVILSIPVILRRLESGVIQAFLDFCPHRGVPISEGQAQGDHIRCRYHGWTFDSSGECVEIPGLRSPDHPTKLPCLKKVLIQERNGIVWVHFKSDPLIPPPAEPRECQRTFLKKSFPVGLEDLIENFIDPMHTVYVHGGLIRSSRSPSQNRKIKYSASATELQIQHPEQYEKIGLFQGLINPKSAPLRHVDCVQFPNYMTVTYEFVGTSRFFRAEISLCPVGPRQTVAYVSLSFDLGPLTSLARIFIPFLARHILKQDYEILNLLSLNADSKEAIKNMTNRPTVFTSIKNESHYDELRRRMRKIRLGNPDRSNTQGEFELNL
jgi:phenylpropionate dioxygenase-like ring-hydroxylating dioxygenase large terminal subunit